GEQLADSGARGVARGMRGLGDDALELAQALAPARERHEVAVLAAATVAGGGAREVEPLGELGQKPRLADAGIADQHGGPAGLRVTARGGLGVLKGYRVRHARRDAERSAGPGVQPAQLVVATDQRRGVGVDLAGRPLGASGAVAAAEDVEVQA